ncbi:WS/DGAT domain-containing protein, partial [Microbacterium sp.]|uniref:WS/DGAT domain-containing protein n=1 Tax=Microbacterium sp. TaxID=51671 RepID=UPI003C7140B3
TRGRPLPWFVRARAGGRLMRWFLARQRAVGLALSNVRGPATAQRLCGAPVTAAWALPVLSGQSRIGIAAVSYAGRLTVCVLWSDTVGSAGPAFARGMREALEAAVAPG